MVDLKENALLLSSRNRMKWSIKSLLRFQYSSNLLYSWKIWYFISIKYSLYRQLKSSLGKNLSLYLPISVQLTIALVDLVYRELEYPRYLSQDLFLVYVGSRRLLFTLYNSKKYYSFRSDTWKVIFQLERMLLHSLFLLNSQDVKIVESRLSFFLFYFLFFIFRTLGLGMEVIGHTVTLVTFNSVVTTLITELERRK